MQAVSCGLMLLSGAEMRNAPAGSTNCAIVRSGQDIIFSWPPEASGFFLQEADTGLAPLLG